jgi:creatinine amidohydrolase
VTHILPTATEKEEEARDAKYAILPVGSFEQHGSHLPLITDTVVACAISRELVSAYDVFMLPPVTLSCSHEHSAWRGTVSISSRTLQLVIDDVYASVAASGYRSLILVNGHGGNYVLSNIVQEGSAHGKSIALFPASDDWKEARRAGHLATTDHEDMHAGELETSILLYSNPELVAADYHSADWIADDRRHLLTAGMRKYTQNGVIGRPSLATAEKGKAALDSLAESFAEVLQLLNSNMGELLAHSMAGHLFSQRSPCAPAIPGTTAYLHLASGRPFCHAMLTDHPGRHCDALKSAPCGALVAG